MTAPERYSFIRYLAAKKRIDDLALNRHVFARLVTEAGKLARERPLRVLEVGAGIGTMVERLVEWELDTVGQLRHRPLYITALDAVPEHIAETERRLTRWAALTGMQAERTDGGLRLQRHHRGGLVLELEAVDLESFAVRERGRRTWDVLVANAVLDLLDVPAVLPSLLPLIPGGLLYATITFDGVTAFEPRIDPDLDRQIEALYHRTMDERHAGESRAGRHLFHQLRDAGAAVLAMGSSDWTVFPGPHGYEGDDAYFLHFLINTVDQALRGHLELDATRFDAWVAERHAQIERGDLVLITHQQDVLARVS
jgi:hypothetical protein